MSPTPLAFLPLLLLFDSLLAPAVSVAPGLAVGLAGMLGGLLLGRWLATHPPGAPSERLPPPAEPAPLPDTGQSSATALAESQRFLRCTVDALECHLAVLDEHGTILEVNRAWQRFAAANGYVGRAFGIGANYLATCEGAGEDCGDGRMAAHGIRQVIAGTQACFRMEYPCHSPTEQRWFLLRATRFPDAGPLRCVVVHENVTERRLAVDALLDADHRKDEFLAMLAHELRNPLAPLRNALHILKIAGTKPEVCDKARQMMERQVGQLVRLVDDLLDVSRITRNKIELRRERADLAGIVRSAIETSRPLIDAARHTLTVTLPAEPLEVDGDPTRLAQVFANLLNNAAKYTPPEGRIAISAAAQDGHAVIRVRDNGAGIPAAVLPRIFEMFSQGDRTLERSQGGLGVGLALVKRLVEMHGGSVEAHSAGENQGSEFVVRLPAVAGVPRAIAAPETVIAAVPGRPRHGIVVADDDADSATSLAVMLQMMGHEVHVAYDGQAAIETVARTQPGIVFLDLGMPRMNGCDAARRIRALPGGDRIVLVAITGWGQEEDRRKSRAAGFDAHLVKPVDPAALERFLSVLQAGSASPAPAAS